jgi:hypothetical protein
MPATLARGGFGTKIFRDDGTGTFVAIAELGDISGPGESQMIEDATHMESPDGFAEKIAVGVRETGDLTFSMHLLIDDAGHNALYTDMRASTKRNFRLVHPAGTKRWSFAGFVQSIGQSYPLKGKLVNDVTITITGKAVLEANS